jgi:manganese/zinc/iron transport system permease protein
MMAELFASIPAMVILTGVLTALSGALLGSFLVLRGASLVTDAISHSVLFGIVIVWLLTGQRSGALVVAGAAAAGLLTVVLSELLSRSRLVRDDAAIGLVFPALFAGSILLVSLYASDLHLDTHAVLLGEIGFVWLNTTALAGVEVPVAVLTLAGVLALNAAFVGLFWKELKLTTFDAEFAALLGFLPAVLNHALVALTSATAVAAFDAVGVVLFVAFVIIPAATARLLTDRLALMVPLAAALGAVAAVAGYALAVRLDVSIGGMMAVVAAGGFAAALLLAPGGLLGQRRRAAARAGDLDRLALLVHLETHADSDREAEESTTAALIGHLGWPEARARQAIARALDEGLVLRAEGGLRLTAPGSALARAVFDPATRAARG